MKKLYLGDFNNSKKDELLDMAIDYSRENRGDRFLYILPNGSLLTRYRKYIIDKVESTNNLNIYTFDDIANRLAKRVDSKLISKKIKEVFIDDIVGDLSQRGKLNYYKNMVGKKGFIKNIGDIISQMKSSLIRAENLIEMNIDSSEFLELNYIYLEYEELLKKNKLMDEDDKYLHTIDGLKENYRGFLKDIDFVVIDEFYDFRPQELEIIKEISKLDIDIYINMPFNRGNNFIVISETVDYLLKLEFELEIVEKNKLSYFEELSSIMFDEGKKIKGDRISLTKAPSREIEVDDLATIIKKEVAGGRDIGEMALVITSSKYNSIVDRVFHREGIPYSRGIDELLVNTPLIKELFYLLDYSIESKKTSFINRIKCRYFSICPYEEIEEIEFDLRNRSLDIEDLSQLYKSKSKGDLIDQILADLMGEKSKLRTQNNISDFSETLLDIIDENNIEERIINIYDRTGDYDIFYRDLKTLEIVKASLDEIIGLDKKLFGKISLEDYKSILFELLEGKSLVLHEGNSGGINILSPAMLRGHQYELVFIVGLSQGDYPNLTSKNFFFKDENSYIFKEINLDYKNYYERLDRESLNFIIGISQVKSRLYLSYSENIAENESAIPSIFLDELLYSLEGDKVEDKLEYRELELDYSFKKNLEDITTIDEFTSYILRKKNTSRLEYGKLNSMDSRRLRNIKIRSEGELERSRGLSNYSGFINDLDILKNINSSLDGKKYSISFLESYASCPYAFLLNRILKIDEYRRDIEEFDNMDRGSINHLVLQDFYSNFQEEIRAYVLGKGQIDMDKVRSYLEGRYRLNLENMGIDSSSSLYRLKAEINTKKIWDYIGADLNRLREYDKKLLPFDYEREFGRKKEFYLEMKGERVYLTGVIDRIDKFVDEDSYIIMDYKNSTYGLANRADLLEGKSLQMPVYIMSMEDKKVLAAIYGVISSGGTEILMVDKSEKEIIGRRRSGVYTREEFEEILDISKEYIFEYVGRIKSGDFRIETRDCSSYCQYKDICRVKKSLEVENE